MRRRKRRNNKCPRARNRSRSRRSTRTIRRRSNSRGKKIKIIFKLIRMRTWNCLIVRIFRMSMRGIWSTPYWLLAIIIWQHVTSKCEDYAMYKLIFNYYLGSTSNWPTRRFRTPTKLTTRTPFPSTGGRRSLNYYLFYN